MPMCPSPSTMRRKGEKRKVRMSLTLLLYYARADRRSLVISYLCCGPGTHQPRRKRQLSSYTSYQFKQVPQYMKRYKISLYHIDTQCFQKMWTKTRCSPLNSTKINSFDSLGMPQTCLFLVNYSYQLKYQPHLHLRSS